MPPPNLNELLSTSLMGSLSVTKTRVPSTLVSALTKIGRTPSTLWSVLADTAPWISPAAVVPTKIVPPLRSINPNSTATPSASKSPSTTV